MTYNSFSLQVLIIVLERLFSGLAYLLNLGIYTVLNYIASLLSDSYPELGTFLNLFVIKLTDFNTNIGSMFSSKFNKLASINTIEKNYYLESLEELSENRGVDVENLNLRSVKKPKINVDDIVAVEILPIPENINSTRKTKSVKYLFKNVANKTSREITLPNSIVVTDRDFLGPFNDTEFINLYDGSRKSVPDFSFNTAKRRNTSATVYSALDTNFKYYNRTNFGFEIKNELEEGEDEPFNFMKPIGQEYFTKGYLVTYENGEYNYKELTENDEIIPQFFQWIYVVDKNIVVVPNIYELTRKDVATELTNHFAPSIVYSGNVDVGADIDTMGIFSGSVQNAEGKIFTPDEIESVPEKNYSIMAYSVYPQLLINTIDGNLRCIVEYVLPNEEENNQYNNVLEYVIPNEEENNLNPNNDDEKFENFNRIKLPAYKFQGSGEIVYPIKVETISDDYYLYFTAAKLNRFLVTMSKFDLYPDEADNEIINETTMGINDFLKRALDDAEFIMRCKTVTEDQIKAYIDNFQIIEAPYADEFESIGLKSMTMLDSITGSRMIPLELGYDHNINLKVNVDYKSFSGETKSRKAYYEYDMEISSELLKLKNKNSVDRLFAKRFTKIFTEIEKFPNVLDKDVQVVTIDSIEPVFLFKEYGFNDYLQVPIDRNYSVSGNKLNIDSENENENGTSMFKLGKDSVIGLYVKIKYRYDSYSLSQDEDSVKITCNVNVKSSRVVNKKQLL